MPSSFDVTLPRGVKPKFPDRCPCGLGKPEGKGVRLSFVGYSASPSLWQYALGMSTVGTNSVDYATVPASDACARQLKRYHFWIKVAKYVLWAPLFFTPLLLGWNIYICITLLLSALILPVIWEITHPPPVGATPKPNEICWEFADRAYAEEFARLNGTVIDGTVKPPEAPAS